jgi:hypothetical protein
MKRLLSAVAAAFIGLSAVAVSSPAQAGGIVDVFYADSSVTVNGDSTAKMWNRTYVRVYDPNSSISTNDISMNWCQSCTWYLASRLDNYATFYLKWYVVGANPAGRYKETVTIDFWDYDLNGNREITATGYMWVRRPSRLTMDAVPEPVSANGVVKISGRLLIDAAKKGPYYGPNGTTVTLHFKRQGTASYVAAGFTTTKNGYYSFNRKQRARGTWMVKYAGSSTKNAQAKTDSVSFS